MSEDERGGRDVLYFVGLVLADRPDEAAAVADRLEKELQELLTGVGADDAGSCSTRRSP